MFTVSKDGRTMEVRNEVQLEAFLSSGWAVAEDPKPAKEEVVEEAKEEEVPKKRTRTARK